MVFFNVFIIQWVMEKKNFLIPAVILAAVAVFALGGCVAGDTAMETPRVNFPEENISVSVEIADSREGILQGMMYREELGEFAGMLFIFQEPKLAGFWMKNMLIPLDMIFISEGKEIVRIEENVPPCITDDAACETYGKVLAKYVLEVNSGFAEKYGISEGEKVKIILERS